MKINLSEEAIKNLLKINKTDAKNIKEKIIKFQANPGSCDFKKLQGYTNRYRIRQRNYRIICERLENNEKSILYVISTRHRQEAYD